MRIGIDIDNTIAKTYEKFLEYAIVYDKNFLRGSGIINQDKIDFVGKFDWTNEEDRIFMKKYSPEILSNLDLIEDSKEIINKLAKEGNEIYFITLRNEKVLQDPFGITKKWLEKNNIFFNKIITVSSLKGKICKENNIDILIDDGVSHYIDTINYGIKSLLFNSIYNKDSDLKRVYNWKEVYELITKNN